MSDRPIDVQTAPGAASSVPAVRRWDLWLLPLAIILMLMALVGIAFGFPRQFEPLSKLSLVQFWTERRLVRFGSSVTAPLDQSGRAERKITNALSAISTVDALSLAVIPQSVPELADAAVAGSLASAAAPSAPAPRYYFSAQPKPAYPASKPQLQEAKEDRHLSVVALEALEKDAGLEQHVREETLQRRAAGLSEGGRATQLGGPVLNFLKAKPAEPSSIGVAQPQALSMTPAPSSKLVDGRSKFESQNRASVKPTEGTMLQLRANLAEADAKLDGYAEVEPPSNTPAVSPESVTLQNRFSTFSLNVSDVSFRLAAASLQEGRLPEPSSIRVEEFVNAFDYRDAMPNGGQGVSLAWERSQAPTAHDRDFLRLSVRTAASGREANKPLHLVLLLDNSGSMERSDRVQILREAMKTLAAQMHPQDRVSVVTFARTARLWVDGVTGDHAGELAQQLNDLVPEGGTNLEEALKLGYQTAARHFQAEGGNRVVLLTDGAANLGEVDAQKLRDNVIDWRRKGVALDCFGIGWEGLNDPLLETLSRNGDGRYGFVNSPEEAGNSFASQLVGALRVAASDVKVQVEFNPDRVTLWRQVGYALHQLKKEDFRNRAIDAAELGASEAGTAVYLIQTMPQGSGPIGTVSVRYHRPGSEEDVEQAWSLPYTGIAPSLPLASPAQRLAATASTFGEWLARSPYAAEVAPDRLLQQFQGVAGFFSPAPGPRQLEAMIRQSISLSGK